MHWTNLGLILVAGLDLGMALLIWLRNPRHKINISFAVAIFFLAVWTFGCGMFREAASPPEMIQWVRVLNIGGIMLIIPFLFFTFYFPHQKQMLSRRIKATIFLSTVAVLAILFSPNVWFPLDSIIIKPPRNYFSVNFGYYLFVIYFLSYIIWAYYNLLMKCRVSGGFDRTRLNYIIFGTAPLSLFGTLFGTLSPLLYGAKYFWIGPYFVLPMIVYLVYFGFYYQPK